MGTIPLAPDFREFLRLLNSHGVEYLLVGGYAVAFHGYPRATLDLDVWIAVSPGNSSRVAGALREFGFDLPEIEGISVPIISHCRLKENKRARGRHTDLNDLEHLP